MLRVELPRGLKWSKSEALICSEGLNCGKSWAAKEVKLCRIEGVIFLEGVKFAKSWDDKG